MIFEGRCLDQILEILERAFLTSFFVPKLQFQVELPSKIVL
jgi:hypothetical protein